MPRKPIPTSENISDAKEDATAVAEETTSIDEKLELVVMYLHRLDRRDRLRTIGGTIRGFLGLIPLIFVIASMLYFYQHGDEFIRNVTKEAVKQSAEYSQGAMMEQLKQYMQK